MESSAGGDGGGIGVDCGVGTIVWVRRRNGSWWPGRILGLDELSTSHLMSPRSGTPVKLLGREDASVDWYNLEKSKRVKAFRCGEFDSCIERAEASQCTPIKKREKYARREDAILHALELEKQQQVLGTTTYLISNENGGSHRSEPSNICSPESYMRHDEHATHRNLSSYKPPIVMTKLDFSQEEDNWNNSSSYANTRSNKQFRREEDIPKAMPRMRGLQDFCLQTAQSKRKSFQFADWKDAIHASSSKNSVSVRRKRSQSRVAEETFMKKRDRRRPLVQVLQSSVMLASLTSQCCYDDVEKAKMLSICRAKRSSCVYLPHDSDDTREQDSELVLANQFGTSKFIDNPVDVVEGYATSGLIEENDSDSAEDGYLEANMGQVANMSTDKACLRPGLKDCETTEFRISEKFRRLNDDEMPHSEPFPQLHEHVTDPSAEVGVSKWHMKGKRNTRNIGKKPMDAGDGTIYSAANCNGSMNETSCKNIESSLNFEIVELSNEGALSCCLYPKRESFYNCDEGDFIKKDLGDRQLNIYDDWRNPTSLPITGGDGPCHNCLSLDDSNEPSNLTHSPLCEEPVEHFHPELEPFLFDVDIKVEASYQGEHVPLVSLMSRLNGKAIIGHPIQIELLESGSTIHLVSKFDAVTDETATPSPMWRTGRRTAMQRVPRVNPLTTSDTPQSRSKKFQKKNSKRISFSNQKTRTLSSFVLSDKLGDERSCVKLTRSSDILEGLIKAEGFVPLVPCIPVKVVFSRLLEAVGKPSSAVARRIRMSSPVIGDLSYQLSHL